MVVVNSTDKVENNNLKQQSRILLYSLYLANFLGNAKSAIRRWLEGVWVVWRYSYAFTQQYNRAIAHLILIREVSSSKRFRCHVA